MPVTSFPNFAVAHSITYFIITLNGQCLVAQKTVSVTADVVGHKYGESAGKLVNDTGESAGNIVRTIKLVSMLSSGKTFTKSVAKNTGKTNVLQEKDDVNPKIDDQ